MRTFTTVVIFQNSRRIPIPWEKRIIQPGHTSIPIIFMLRTGRELTGILIVVHQVEENDALHEDIPQNRANGDTDVVFLVPVMADVGLES